MTSVVDAYASYPHYRDHILPIWDALPREARGAFHEPPSYSPRGGFVIVASLHDLRKVWPRPAIFVEHGAGQTYIDSKRPDGYAGGPGRGTVRLFLNPTERVHDLNRAAYPQAKHALTGSSRLEWLRTVSADSSERREHASYATAPAYSFHWDCKISPEARSAWPHYQDLPNWVDTSTVLGHGHPRIWSQLRRWWESVGAEPVQSFTNICSRASVYVCDNSSTIYEAAALDIPVVLLNAPWYRRDVWHGLRFWEHLPGPMVSQASQLPNAIEEAPEWYVDREQVTEAVYGEIDGAAKRAAAAILELLD